MKYATYVGWRRAYRAAVPGYQVIFEGGQKNASAYIEYRGFAETHRIDVGKWTGAPGVVQTPPLLPLPPGIERLARQIFTTDRGITQLCNSPAPALGGRKPIEMLHTLAGINAIESVLKGIAYGNVM